MAFKFECPQCNETVISKYLKVGEIVKCNKCGSEVVIPENAIFTVEKSSLLLDSSDIIKELKKNKTTDNNGKIKQYPGVLQALLLLLVFYIIYIALGIPFGIIALSNKSQLYTHPLVLILLQLAATTAVLYYSMKRTKKNIKSVLRLTKFRQSLILPIFFTMIGWIGIFSHLSIAVFSSIPNYQVMINDFELLFSLSGWGTILLFVVITPLTEEFLFRGLMLRGFLGRYSKTKSIFLSALLFAVIHWYPLNIFNGLILGLFFAWWYIKTQSLWPCIIGHVTANLFVVVLQLYYRSHTANQEISQYHPISIVLTMGPLLFLVGLLMQIFMFRQKVIIKNEDNFAK